MSEPKELTKEREDEITNVLETKHTRPWHWWERVVKDLRAAHDYWKDRAVVADKANAERAEHNDTAPHVGCKCDRCQCHVLMGRATAAQQRADSESARAVAVQGMNAELRATNRNLAESIGELSKDYTAAIERADALAGAAHAFLKKHFAGEDTLVEAQNLIEALTGRRPLSGLDTAKVVGMLDATKAALAASPTADSGAKEKPDAP